MKSKNQKMKDAAELFEAFTGKPATKYHTESLTAAEVLVEIGEVEGIAYKTVRDGKTIRAFHPFKRGSRPKLCVSHDGKQVVTIGGNFIFGENGFEDK